MKRSLILVSAIVLSSALSAEEAKEAKDISAIDFRVQVNPPGGYYGSGYYATPPYCPPGYYYGYGRRGLSLFYGPGYYYGRCYPYGRSYYPGPYYHYYRRRHR